MGLEYSWTVAKATLSWGNFICHGNWESCKDLCPVCLWAICCYAVVRIRRLCCSNDQACCSLLGLAYRMWRFRGGLMRTALNASICARGPAHAALFQDPTLRLDRFHFEPFWLFLVPSHHHCWLCTTISSWLVYTQKPITRKSYNNKTTSENAQKRSARASIF